MFGRACVQASLGGWLQLTHRMGRLAGPEADGRLQRLSGDQGMHLRRDGVSCRLGKQTPWSCTVPCVCVFFGDLKRFILQTYNEEMRFTRIQRHWGTPAEYEFFFFPGSSRLGHGIEPFDHWTASGFPYSSWAGDRCAKCHYLPLTKLPIAFFSVLLTSPVKYSSRNPV